MGSFAKARWRRSVAFMNRLWPAHHCPPHKGTILKLTTFQLMNGLGLANKRPVRQQALSKLPTIPFMNVSIFIKCVPIPPRARERDVLVPYFFHQYGELCSVSFPKCYELIRVVRERQERESKPLELLAKNMCLVSPLHFRLPWASYM